jgi:parvulin-like peptidyl-prolyl isomerase
VEEFLLKELLMSKFTMILIGAVLVGLSGLTYVVLAEEPASAPAEQPAAPVADDEMPPMPPMPAPAPALPPETPLLKVGSSVMTQADLNDQLQALSQQYGPISPEMMGMVTEQVRGQFIIRTLLREYVNREGLKPEGDAKAELEKQIKKLQEQIEDMRNQAAIQSMFEKRLSDDAVAAFVKAHPAWFDGGKVTARHILIKAEPTATTKAQLAAKKKLDDIAKQIADGKITFEQAAKDFSEDEGSKADGGSVGEFTFDMMVPQFSEVAFTLAKGAISKPVHSSFGWHLIQVTDTKPGDGKPVEDANDKAKNVIQGLIQMQVLGLTSGEVPIVDLRPEPKPVEPAPVEKAPVEKAPAPTTQPAE